MNGFEITSFKLFLTDPQTRQFRNSFCVASSFGKESIEKIINRSDGGSTVATSNMSGVVSDVFDYSSGRIKKESAIDEGWEEERIRWQLSCCYRQQNKLHEYILTGWSDHAGVTNRGTRGVKIDDNMILYVNDIKHVIKDVRNPSQRALKSSNQVMLNTDRNQIDIGIRPTDNLQRIKSAAVILENIDPRHEGSAMGMGSEFDLDSMLGNGSKVEFRQTSRSTVNDSLQLNRRDNNSMVGYLSGQVDAVVSARVADQVDNLDEGDHRTLESHFYTGCQENLASRESEAESDIMLTALARVSDLLNTGCFTVKQLSQFDISNSLQRENVVQYFEPDVGGFKVLDIADGDWRDSMVETTIAAIVRDSLPSILMRCWVTHARFMYSNVNLSNTDVVEAIPIDAGRGDGDRFTDMPLATTYENVNLGNAWNFIERKFKEELVPTLTDNGIRELELEVDMNVEGDCFISVKLEDYPQFITYSTPMYCDRLVQPIVTTESETANSIAKVVNNISNAVAGERIKMLDRHGVLDRSGRSDTRGRGRHRREDIGSSRRSSREGLL